MEKQEKLREELNENFSSAIIDGDISSLQTLYSKLKKLNRNIKASETECVDLSDLAENICIAADIILRDSGKTVVFCGNDVSPVFSNRQILTKAVLEAVGNACIHGESPLVTVKTQERKRFVTAEIQCMGNFLPQNSESLEFIKNAVKKFDGEALTVYGKEFSSVVMTFKKANKINPMPNKNFIELVSDRLSPVFVELYGM